MNEQDLRKLFPNAGAAFIALNSGGDVPNAKPQRHKAPALGKAVPGKTEGPARVTVRFVGYRVRPLDPDNFAGSVKDLLDGLRRAGLIHEDTPEAISLQTEQVRVKTFTEEKTVIEIIP